jgi:hypothetical protein
VPREELAATVDVLGTRLARLRSAIDALA